MKLHKRLQAIKEIHHHDMLANSVVPKHCRRYRSADNWLHLHYDFSFNFCGLEMVATIDHKGEVISISNDLGFDVEDIFNIVVDTAIKIIYRKLTGDYLC